MRRIYLRTDTLEDVCRNAEFAAGHFSSVQDDSYQWKWVVLGLHSTLQSIMVAVLRDSAGINILRSKIRARLLKALQENATRPAEHLDDFLNLYEGTQSEAMQKYAESKPLAPTQGQDASIRMLHKLRNEFVHFVPKHWSIEVSGLPEAVMECVTVIRFLAFESGNILWTDGKGVRVKDALSKIDAGSTSLKASYGG